MRLTSVAAWAAIILPVPVSPVNDSLSMSLLVTSSEPTTVPGPGTRFRTPAGISVSWHQLDQFVGGRRECSWPV